MGQTEEKSPGRANPGNPSTLEWLECRRGDGWNPRLFYALAYVGAGISFIIMMNITTFVDIYDLPYYPLTKMVFGEGRGRWYGNWHASLLLIGWSEHYVRRVVEVLFVHVYHRSDTSLVVFGSMVYYTFFGTWVGWSVNVDWYTWLRKGPPPYMVGVGILLFMVGEGMNAYCHWLLMRVRRPARKGRRRNVWNGGPDVELVEAVSYKAIPSRQSSEVNPSCANNNGAVLPTTSVDESPPEETPDEDTGPDSPLFRYVSYPHYIFEFIAWVGYACLSFTWATWTFALVSGAVMLYRAITRRRRQK